MKRQTIHVLAAAGLVMTGLMPAAAHGSDDIYMAQIADSQPLFAVRKDTSSQTLILPYQQAEYKGDELRFCNVSDAPITVYLTNTDAERLRQDIDQYGPSIAKKVLAYCEARGQRIRLRAVVSKTPAGTDRTGVVGSYLYDPETEKLATVEEAISTVLPSKTAAEVRRERKQASKRKAQTTWRKHLKSSWAADVTTRVLTGLLHETPFAAEHDGDFRRALAYRFACDGSKVTVDSLDAITDTWIANRTRAPSAFLSGMSELTHSFDVDLETHRYSRHEPDTWSYAFEASRSLLPTNFARIQGERLHPHDTVTGSDKHRMTIAPAPEGFPVSTSSTMVFSGRMPSITPCMPDDSGLIAGRRNLEVTNARVLAGIPFRDRAAYDAWASETGHQTLVDLNVAFDFELTGLEAERTTIEGDPAVALTYQARVTEVRYRDDNGTVVATVTPSDFDQVETASRQIASPSALAERLTATELRALAHAAQHPQQDNPRYRKAVIRAYGCDGSLRDAVGNALLVEQRVADRLNKFDDVLTAATDGLAPGDVIGRLTDRIVDTAPHRPRLELPWTPETIARDDGTYTAQWRLRQAETDTSGSSDSSIADSLEDARQSWSSGGSNDRSGNFVTERRPIYDDANVLTLREPQYADNAFNGATTTLTELEPDSACLQNAGSDMRRWVKPKIQLHVTNQDALHRLAVPRDVLPAWLERSRTDDGIRTRSKSMISSPLAVERHMAFEGVERRIGDDGRPIVSLQFRIRKAVMYHTETEKKLAVWTADGNGDLEGRPITNDES